MLDDLRGEVAGPSVLIWRSLFADCLRLIYSTMMADGVIYDLELERTRDLLTAIARHYTGTRNSPFGDRPPVDLSSTRTFLDHYAQDNGPFGYGAEVRWRGYVLCRRAEAVGESEPLLRYAHLMRWLIEEACKVSDVSFTNPQWHGRLSDIDELRHALVNTGIGPQVEVDRRVREFLGRDRVFAQIEYALSVYEADPFDVEMLHSEARASFRRLMQQVTTQSRQAATGRTLLVVGSSGAGKTHLLRGFWSYAQEYGRGFAAYAQMCAKVDDYSRYFLHHVVESLQCPYSGQYDGRTGLEELALGLVQIKGREFAERVERLAELTGGARSALDQQINILVDELLDQPVLANFDPDLLRVLLYALCRDSKITSRVYLYLRCEDMNDHDRGVIGNVVARTTTEAPREMLRKLAKLAYVTRGAPFVLMVDQMELSGVDSNEAMAAFQRAVDALLSFVSEVHSVIVVIACLSNLYNKALKVLGRPTLDRLDKDPKPVHITSNLAYDEIKAIVGHRLAWLFAEKGAVYRTSEPVYPIPEDLLRNLVNRRPRMILDWCQGFHERCVAAGRILDTKELGSLAPPPLGPLPSIPAPSPVVDRIATAWDVAYQAARVPASLTDEEVVRLLTLAAQAYAVETGVSMTSAPHKDSMLRLQVATAAGPTALVVGVTNRAPAAGAFGSQIKKLRQAARGSIPIAVRTEEFPSGATSIKVVAQLTEAGGRTSYLDKPTLRTLVAYQQFRPAFAPEHMQAWQRSKRPISSMQRIAAMFNAGRLSSDSSPGATADQSAGERDAPRDETPRPVDPAAVATQARERADGQSRAVGR
jgi:hypothetical protein